MAGSGISDYIQKQLNAGYSKDEIYNALVTQGWTDQEINEAFSMVREPPKVHPPVNLEKKNLAAFLLALIGGLVIFISGMEHALSLPLITGALGQAGLNLGLLGIFETALAATVLTGTISLVFGIILIVGSVMIDKVSMHKLGGILVIIFSVLSLVGFHGFLIALGGILGIIGGILAFRNSY